MFSQPEPELPRHPQSFLGRYSAHGHHRHLLRQLHLLHCLMMAPEDHLARNVYDRSQRHLVLAHPSFCCVQICPMIMCFEIY